MKKIATLIFILCLVPIMAFAADGDPLSSLYMPSPADQSVIYLGYIFGVVNGVLHGTGSQIMGKMFGQYNSAVLALAGLVVIYTTLLGVLNTAHEGEFLGKKYSSFFIPFRTILGILLITPTSTGYSWIQTIALWIVLQGVTAANLVWHAAVGYVLHGGGVLVVQNQDITSSISTSVRTEITKLVPATTCLHILQNIQTTIGADTSSTAPTPPTQTPVASVLNALDAINFQYGSLYSVSMPSYDRTTDPLWSRLNGMCGNINNIDSTAIIATKQALLDMYQSTASMTGLCDAGYYKEDPASGIWTKQPQTPTGFFITSTCGSPDQCRINGIPKDATIYPYNPYGISGVTEGKTPILSWCNPINTAANPNYDQAINVATLDFLGLTYKNLHPNNSALETLQKAETSDPTYSSWFNAGTYYFALLLASSHAQSGSSGSPIAVYFPSNLYGSNNVASSLFQGLANQSGASTLSMSKQNITNKVSDIDPFLPYLNQILAWSLPFFVEDLGGASSAGGNNQLINYFLNIQKDPADYNHPDRNAHGDPKSENNATFADEQGSVVNASTAGGMAIIYKGIHQMFDSYHSMQVEQRNNEPPMVLMMNFGAGMIKTALDMWLSLMALYAGLALALGGIPCFSLSSSVNTIVNMLSPLLTAILLPLFVTGGMLLYYLPAVPFMIFTFGTIGWLIGVIEAMIAAPIVGFAIMNPEGNDIFGKGDQGVMLMLNLFLRPPLMIFGLITGIIISSIGIWIINAGFDVSVTTYIIQIGGSYGWENWETALIGSIAVPMIYLIMALQVINRSFTLIYILPDKVTRWMSGGMQESLGSEMAGVEKEVKGAMQSGMEVTGKGTSGLSAGIGTEIGKKLDIKNQQPKAPEPPKPAPDEGKIESGPGGGAGGAAGGGGGGGAAGGVPPGAGAAAGLPV